MKKCIKKPDAYNYIYWDGENKEELKEVLKNSSLIYEKNSIVKIDSENDPYGYFWIIPDPINEEKFSTRVASYFKKDTFVLKNTRTGNIFFVTPEYFVSQFVELQDDMTNRDVSMEE